MKIEEDTFYSVSEDKVISYDPMQEFRRLTIGAKSKS
jgi:hypothetical protein